MVNLSPRRIKVLFIAVHLLLFLGAIFVTRNNERIPDDFFYADWSHSVIQGQIPYRDFSFAYPPVAFVPFLLPRLALGGHQNDWPLYHQWFGVESLLLEGLIAFLFFRLASRYGLGLRRTLIAFSFYTLFVCIGASVIAWRFDSFPTALTLLFLYALEIERPLGAGIALGLAIATKIYPIVLVPLLGIYYLVSGQRERLNQCLLGIVGSLVLVELPFLFLAPNDWLSFLAFNINRGLHLESLAGGMLALGHVLHITHMTVQHGSGSFNITGPGEQLSLQILPILFLALYALGLFCSYRLFSKTQAATQPLPQNSLVAMTVLVLLAFILCNKVFSPQYLMWIMPLVPLLGFSYSLAFLGICLMTFTLYPYRYEPLIHLALPEVLALNLKNGLLLGLAIALIRKACWPGYASPKQIEL